MGLFQKNPAKQAAKLEAAIKKKESKLETVKKQLPQPEKMQPLVPGITTGMQAITDLRRYVEELDRRQQGQIDALDQDVGDLAKKLKLRIAAGSKGGGMFGAGEEGGGDMMSMMFMLLLLGGGLGGSSSGTTGGLDTTTLLLLMMMMGGGGGGGMSSMFLLLLLL